MRARLPVPCRVRCLETRWNANPPQRAFDQLAGKSWRPLRTRISDAILVIPFGFYSAMVNRARLWSGPISWFPISVFLRFWSASCTSSPHEYRPFGSPASTRRAGSQFTHRITGCGNRDNRARRTTAYAGTATRKVDRNPRGEKQRDSDSIAPYRNQRKPGPAGGLYRCPANAHGRGFCRESGIGNRESKERERGNGKGETKFGRILSDSRFPIPDFRKSLDYPPPHSL
jgi:hypothetical protein